MDLRTVVLGAACATGLLSLSASATAGVITNVSFNTTTGHSYDGGWGDGGTITRTLANTTDSMDGDGAAVFTVTPSVAPPTTYWRQWEGLGWFAVNNSQAVADPSQIMVSFDARATNIGNSIPGAINLGFTVFHSGADVGWAQQNSQAGNATVQLTNTWAHYSLPLSTWNAAMDLSGNRNFLVVQLNMSADGGSGYAGFNGAGVSTVSFDNLKLATVPEPVSIAMLGIVPLALAMRRRRVA